jgi:hypothetical protein
VSTELGNKMQFVYINMIDGKGLCQQGGRIGLFSPLVFPIETSI